MKQILYTCGYKYRLEKLYENDTAVVGYDIDTPWIKLTLLGRLTLLPGFAWDGPSGPTKDDDTNMRGSAEHDAFYKLMRMGLIPLSERDVIDHWLRHILTEDGTSELRADYWYSGVHNFAAAAANPKNKKQVITAPANILFS